MYALFYVILEYIKVKSEWVERTFLTMISTDTRDRRGF